MLINLDEELISMFGLGLPEIIIISVVGIAIFGAKRIPELGRAVGQSLKGFRQELHAESEPPKANPKTDSDNKSV